MPCNILNERMFHLRSQDIGPRRRISAPLALVIDYRLLSPLSLSFSSILWSPLHGDFLPLYSLLKLIRTLHLLTIWTFTWVPVPSDIFLIFLWVALTNVTLFACLLHINAAEKVVFLHLMRQLWLLLDVLHFFLSCCVRLILLPTFVWDGSSLWRGRTLGPYLCVRGDIPSRTSFKTNWAPQDWAKSFLGPYSPLGHGWASCGAPGPLLTLGISPLQL